MKVFKLSEWHYATGKRKNAVAKVWLRPGEGNIIINDQPMKDYLNRMVLEMIILHPLELVKGHGTFDVIARVEGGGKSGQAGAVRLGIARALVKFEPVLRGVLKSAGYLSRDAREKERKKYGHKRARKSFQYSKR